MSDKKPEQTFVLIKPDALKLSLTGYLFSQMSETHAGFIIAATKVVNVTKMLAEEHYAEHQGKVFFPSLIEYIRGMLHYPDIPGKRRVIAIVYQGENAVARMRQIAGPTNPHVAREEKPGCIRSLGTVITLKNDKGQEIGSRMDNLVHASANLEDAEREIKLWLQPSDIPPKMRTFECAESEKHYYYKDNGLLTEFEPGSVGFLAPGNVAWKSDLEALERMEQGKEAPCTLNSVVAKYLLNRYVSE